MKLYTNLRSAKFIAMILFFITMLTAGPAFGAASSGYSEYYIPADEDAMRTVLNDIAYDDISASNMHAVISVTAWSANTTVYYDHWENGYNFDKEHPVSTADETYTLINRGDAQVWEESNIPLPRASHLNKTTSPTTYYHDGRDRIYVAGGSATVARASWTESAGTLLAVAWEVYPVRPQLTTYIMPFGEDLARDTTKNYWDFDRVYNLIQATADNTFIQVDLNKDGVYDSLNWDRSADGSLDGTATTLDRGEVLLLDRVTIGDQAINGATVNGSTNDNLLIAGTRIQASSTIQVQYVVGDQGSNYEIRGLSAFPRGFWDSEYYAPVHGGAPANDGDTDIYLYNPNETVLRIDYQTNSGSGWFNINPKTTLSYYQGTDQNGTASYVPTDSAVYLKGSAVFWGVSIVDTSHDDTGNYGAGRTHDWGYSLVPAFLLDNEHFLGWALGAFPVDPTGGDRDDSGVYISPAQDNIRVYVDFDPTDTTPYNDYRDLDRLDSWYVYDTTDGDMTNANIYATGPYVAAYGQNPDTSPIAVPAIDVGYTTIPGNDFIDLVLNVHKRVDPGMLPTGTGQQTTFTLEVDTGKYPVDGVFVVDDLPDGWAYMTDTTTITLPDGSTGTSNPALSGTGNRTLTWDNSTLGSMAPNQKLYISYDAEATGTFSAADLSKNNVTAIGTRTVESVTQTFTTSDFAFVAYGDGILDITKTSDVTSAAYPGDTINYTVTITNSGTAALTNVSVYDPLPAGVSYVPSSALVSVLGSLIRVTEYYINTGFTGITYNLTLNQNLAANYFVIVRGADSDGGSTTGPNVNYVALTADPFSTGDLGNSGAVDQITLTRAGNYNGWVGVVTVVECLGDPTGNGFTLRNVNRVVHTGTAANGTDTSATNWNDINQVMLMGGFYGPGCNTAETSSKNSVSCFARIWPTGANTINWTRDAGTATLATSTSTVMVLEWGNAWTVQRENVTGSNGGTDADQTGEYNTAPINPVVRANTWVWGTGTTTHYGLGSGAEGVLVTLGDGVNINPNESTVAIGKMYNTSTADFEVYAITHSDLAVDYRFKANNDQAALTVNVSVNSATSNRMALVYNGCNGTGAAYPRPIFSARYTSDTNVELERRYSGQSFPAWVQGIDFSGIQGPTVSVAAGDPPDFKPVCSSGNYRDNIDTGGGYSQTDGSLDWSSTPWVEQNDSGTSQSPTNGRIRIKNNRIRFEGANDNDAIVRQADVTDASSVTVSFDFSESSLDDFQNEIIHPEWSPDGTAGSYTALGAALGENDAGTYTFDLSDYGWTTDDDTVYLRFRATGDDGVPSGWSNKRDDEGYINWVDISLTTCDNWDVSAGEVLALTYQVTVNDPLPTGISEITNTVSATSAEIFTPIYASVTDPVVNPDQSSASVGDRVWLDINGNGVQDPGESGLSNIEVTLKDQYGTPLQTMLTNSTGYYLFSHVALDTGYYVAITGGLPSGLTQTTDSRTDNRTDSFDLQASEYLDADLGYQPAANTAIIGDLVWSDADADGVRDSGEPGLPNVTVRLYTDTNGNGVIDTGETYVSTDTGPDGSYLFTGVTASGTQDYIVWVDQSDFSAYDITTPPSGEHSLIDVAAGGSYLNADFGFVQNTPGATYTIKDRLWLDNGAGSGGIADDGVQNGNEAGISGVTVALLDASLNVIAATTTDGNGDFTFPGVPAGVRYAWQVTDQAGVLSSYYGTTPSALSGFFQMPNTLDEADDVADGADDDVVAYNDPLNPVGYRPHFGYNVSRSLGDTVFNDNGAGGGTANDGIQNGGESGISGVTVVLYRGDADNDFEPGGDDGASLGTLVTDASGKYLFSGLSDGWYWISIDNTQAALNGFDLTSPDDDTSAAGDQQREQITGGVSNFNADFGYQASNPVSISGTIWSDKNQDGGAPGAGEPLFSGVTVDLIRGGSVIASTTTDSNGFYEFTGVPGNNTYIVRVTDTASVLDGYETTYENNEGTDDGTKTYNGEEVVVVTTFDVTNIDFGYYKTVPTYVLVSSFTAYSENGSVVVEWETAAEIGTRGFYLERKDGSGKFVKVNKKAIPAVITSHGGIYQCLDPSAQPGGAYVYRVVELQASGGKSICGPYSVTIHDDTQSSNRSALSMDSGMSGDLMNADLMKNGYARRLRDMDMIVYDPDRKNAKTEFKSMKMYKKPAVPAALNGSGARTTLAIDDPETYDEIKVMVSKPGFYWIGADNIADTVGLAAETISGFIGNHQIRMSNRGRQVAWLPADDHSGLYFYAEPYSSIYTDENVYWIQLQPGVIKGDLNGDGIVDQADLAVCMDVLSGKVSDLRPDYAASGVDVTGNNQVDMAEVAYIRYALTGVVGNVEESTPAGTGEGKTFTATAHFETDTWYTSDVDIATMDFWFWEQFWAGAPLLGLTLFPIEVPGVAAGSHEAYLTVNLQGLSNDLHQITVTLNAGTANELLLGNVAWAGLDEKSQTFVFNQQVLSEGANTINVVGANNGNAEALGLDSFDLSYQKTYVAIDNSLMCNASDNEVITISGFTDADIALFEISDPAYPKRVTNAEIDNANGTVTFIPGEANRPYFAVDMDTRKAPDAMMYDVPSDLKNKQNSAHYLVITADELDQGAQDLAAYRQTSEGGGLSTMVVKLTDVFDEFSNGLYDPFAIRDFIAYALNNWASAPQFVVLVGGGTYDFKQVLAQYDIFVDNLMPVVMINTPYGIYGSDILYGDVDGDDLLDVALGRIPAKTNADVEAVLAKIVSYEAALGSDKQVIMLADTPDPGPFNDFPDDSDIVAALVPEDYPVTKIYLPGLTDAAMRNQFVNLVNSEDGAFLVNYIGHGGYDRMSKSFFTIGNLNLLQNNRYPVYVALTCLVGGFDYPLSDSLGEVLMLKDGSGSIATWAPNGLSVNSEAVKMNQDLFAAIFTDKVGDLGHAVKQALKRYHDSGEMPYPYMIRIYNLLGDPALKVN